MRALCATVVTLPFFLSACASPAAPTTSPTSSVPPTTIAITIYAPSSTQVPTSSPTPETPAPSATSTPNSALRSPLPKTTAKLAPNVDPFTGLTVSDAAQLNRRPVFIKVANTAEVRPQSGLSAADIVFEHYSEGGITRFTALFLANDVTKVGSVRSCRLIDIELPAIFDAALICSGTSPGVKPLMRNSWGFTNNLTMISDFGPFECQGCPMFRTGDAPIPHNLFGNTIDVRKELTTRGNNQRTTFPGFQFDVTPPTVGREATQVDIPYTSGTVGWTYDPTNMVYGRSLVGAPQVDRLTNKQLTVANVIMIYAPHITTLIQEDVTGSQSIEIQLWGQGNAKIVRDGRVIEGQWKRSASTAAFEFVDFDGKQIPLKPGNSWVQLLPVDFKEAIR